MPAPSVRPRRRPRTRVAGATLLAAVLPLLACSGNPSATSPGPPLTSGSPPAPAGTHTASPTRTLDGNTVMNLRLTIDGQQIDAVLNDSATARDFATLLPLTLDLSDFQQTERIAYLSRKLDTSGAPEVSHPQAGDLAYYAPWGNLALFHRDGPRSPGLIILGRVTSADTASAIERLATADRVTIETA
ncbi:cyclophilin-like fold protein [[Actinomadura] parvosata]|uniref:cyclophilin-like fold protein n=1 Tax=[Actinomadura] parvosata TaxID=1955412 RepID=UPI00406C30CA